MKNCFRRACLLCAFVVAALIVWAFTGRSGNYFSSINVKVPDSAIVTHQNDSSLTGDEDVTLLRMSPPQLAALLSQFKTKQDFVWAPRTTTPMPPTLPLSAMKKRFFSGVSRGAQSGSFRFDHKETSPPWPTLCWFSVDQTTGRVWFYGWSVYN